MAQVEEQAPKQEDSAKALEGGSYDVIRQRLLTVAKQLGARADELNQRREATFGGSVFSLLATERVRTEHNCVPRDIRTVNGQLLFAYNVFMGLKSETAVSDVFSIHRCETNGDGFDLSEVEIGPDHFLSDSSFVREFVDLYRYNRETKLVMVRQTDTRLLAKFQVSARAADLRVFRWGIQKDQTLKFIDARGEEDNLLARQHDFDWITLGRDDQISGDHPHYNIRDKVFVECVAGDLTIKVENNTKDGRGVFREAVDDPNQTLDDAETRYAELGSLILISIKPYREEQTRYFVFNTRSQAVVRIDALGSACHTLPEDQGIIFPGGYYLRTGDYKLFEGDTRDMVFRRLFKAPNGEDVLYVYDRISDGTYQLLPYNLIRKDVQTPIPCHGYSVFDDGRLILFKSLSDEPTKVHPMQIWQTPFCTQEHAASAPIDGSYLSKVGNAELVRGISDALTLRRLADSETPTRQSYEDVIGTSKRMLDAYYWLSNAEACDLATGVKDVLAAAILIVDEFEKVAAIQKRSAESLSEAEQVQQKLIDGLRPGDMSSVEDFMGSLSELRKQRGHLITMREMRYMNLPRVGELEAQVVAAFDDISAAAVEFLLKPEALSPLVTRLGAVVEKIGVAEKAADLKPYTADVDKVGEGLTVLSDIINGLKIDDATMRTRILEGISEVYGQLNRARATLTGRRKELAASEGRGEFSAQFKLFGQSVVSALALCDTPEKCDETLSRLLLSLEELEGRFGEFDEFLGDLADKREELTDSLAAKRQTLLDERQRRSQNIASAADRILGGIGRKARTLSTADELNTYFASDAMVMKLRDLSEQLVGIGATVKADELDSRLKSARQDALRALRDKTDLYEGGDNVLKLGKHRFNVNTQPVELALVPRHDEGEGKDLLYVHLTGTDFYERIDDPMLEDNRDLWDQQLVSENATIYRSEFLAACMLQAAERGEEGLSVDKLAKPLLSPTVGPEGCNPLMLELVRQFAQNRHDEGHERGVHDVDAALLLEKLVAMQQTAGRLSYSSDARALAVLVWARQSDAERAVLTRRGQSFGRLQLRLDSVTPQLELARELEPLVRAAAESYRVETTDAEVRVAARYLVAELAAERVRFVTSGSATTLGEALLSELDRAGCRREFDDDLKMLEAHPAEHLGLIRSWLVALIGRYPDLAAHRSSIRETAVQMATARKVDRETSSAATEAVVTGLLGQHPLVRDRQMSVRLDDWLARTERFTSEQVPRFRKFRKQKQELLERERKRLRLDEFAPRILSSFVRNRLINDVYLHMIGDNLAKQLGAAGDSKRTDQMGLLLLVSPPGYGKTTLMEYVANRLGLIFMKVNGPALGHDVTSVDPNDAPNATARQEVDKINLALEMGNNVMLYLDDIQHTNPELLQKFISLCDAQRRIEGVWKGRTRTYDLRGKKFCVVMAGNPYTESGEKFKIPDMLSNRADTYNLGDVLTGKDDVFALSYIENALTSNKALQPLAGREPEDTYKLLKMAAGEAIPVTELAYPYSAAEVGEIVSVFQRLFTVQKVLLRVNQEYIASASQDDNFRTEPAFKLQGSYRNMNKITEKVVAAHTPDEVEAIITDHYAGESQTLTTGAEQNLLKLSELRGRQTPKELERWEGIKKGFVRVKLMGGKDDDPAARVTGSLAGIGEQLSSIDKSLSQMMQKSAEPVRMVANELAAMQELMKDLGQRELLVQVDRDPRLAELLSQQLSGVEASLSPIIKALADSLILASTSARGAADEQAASLKGALAEAAAQVSEMSNAQQRLAAMQGQQAQALQQAGQALQQQNQHVASQQQQLAAQHQQMAAQGQQMAQAQQLAQQMVQMQRQVLGEQQQAAQHAQQFAAHARDAAAHAASLPAAGAGQMTGTVPPGQSLVQRPGASPEENERIARAQQAAANARSQGQVAPELAAAVGRVEGRLGELSHMLAALHQRIGQGAAQVAQAPGDSGPRFDAAIDLQSPSNFYRWNAKADVVTEGGVFIATRRKAPALGQTVLVRLSLPGGVELEARGIIEWTRPVGQPGGPPGFGARFVDLPTYGRQLVDHFIAKRAPLLFEQA